MIISVLVERSLAELEWVLPVCKEIKERDENAKIYLLFLVFDKKDIVKTNKFIMTLVDEIVDGCYDLQDCIWPAAAWLYNQVYKLKEILYKKKNDHSRYDRSQMISDTNAAIIRETGNGNLFLLNKVVGSFKLFIVKIMLWLKSESISFLLQKFILNNRSKLLLKQARHAPFRAVDRAVCFLRTKGIRTAGYPQSTRLHSSYPPMNEDLILFNTEQERAQAVRCEDILGTLATVGVPRYDKGWISYLTSKFDQERKYLLKNHQGRVFFVNLQKEYSWVFSWKKFEIYLDEMLDVLSSYEDALIIFKPHPSQDLNYLGYRIASRNMNERVRISHSSSLTLAVMSDLIITMPSTSIYDLIPSGKPIIEYYDYGLFKEYKGRCAEKNELSDFEKKTSAWPIYSEKSGRPASIYQDLGFVAGASDLQTLEILVRDLVNVKEADGIRHFRNYFPPNAASLAAKEVLEFMASVG